MTILLKELNMSLMMAEWFRLQLQDTKTKIDGSANLLLYGYGSYGNSMSPSFSSTD